MDGWMGGKKYLKKLFIFGQYKKIGSWIGYEKLVHVEGRGGGVDKLIIFFLVASTLYVNFFLIPHTCVYLLR